MVEGKSAWIIVDLVNDFVTGKFGSAAALAAAQRTGKVLDKLQGSAEVIFTLDTHIRDDPEFRVWSEHCLMGTDGCELHSSVSGFDGYRIRKRHFDAFYDTDLDGFLRARNIRNLYLSGVSTDICVLHTASGAFYRGYIPAVVSDLSAAIDQTRHQDALLAMQRNYGARVIDSGALLEELR